MAAARRATAAMRFAVPAATFALLALLASSCAALPGSLRHPQARVAAAPPVGDPLIFGWDGVSGRLLMYSLVSVPTESPSPDYLNTSTWVFTGSAWVAASNAESIPTINAINGVLVYDSTRHREVLAVSGNPYVAEPKTGTWEWDGQAWNAVSTMHPLPFLTQSVSAAYSPELHATVMIDNCAWGPNKPQGQTLLFDGADWRSLTPAHWPGCGAQLAYSPSRHSIVALSLSDYQTWRFDGTDWSPIAAGGSTTPQVSTGMGRGASAVALDQKSDTWVVFGGFDGANYFADTWTGNASGWVKRPSGHSPSRRYCGPALTCMTWDPSLGALVLYGGRADPNGPDLGDTWSWNGRSWVQLAGPIYPETSPPAVASAPRLMSPEPAASAASAARTAAP